MALRRAAVPLASSTKRTLLVFSVPDLFYDAKSGWGGSACLFIARRSDLLLHALFQFRRR